MQSIREVQYFSVFKLTVIMLRAFTTIKCVFKYFAYLRLVIFPTFHIDRLTELIDKKKTHHTKRS